MYKLISKFLGVVTLQFLVSQVWAQGLNSQLLEKRSRDENISPAQVYTLLKFSDLKKYQFVFKSILPKLNKLDREGEFRIWAIDVSGNKNHYCLSSSVNDLNSIRFDCHKTTKEIKTRIGNIENEKLSGRLNRILDSPIIFPKVDMIYGSSVEHIFIVEKFLKGRYCWAIREFQGDRGFDYFELIDIFSRLENVKVSMAWRIEEKKHE